MTGTSDDQQAAAREHLWMHFTKLASFTGAEIPVITRGEGCHVWDQHGRRYVDGLAGLFTVQVGHGRRELAAAAAAQAETLAYSPIWAKAHPPAIALAQRLATLAPAGLERVFFTSGGSESVESAWKLARQYFRAIGQPERYKVIARRHAYHGTTLGALAITGIPALREPFAPMLPGVTHVPDTNRYRHPLGADEHAFSHATTDAIDEAIRAEGPETVAAIVLEPVQNGGGCIPPPAGYFARVRELCDRYGILLVSDEVICAFGRLGHTFGAQRYGYEPDMITCAKGLTSGYAPLGAVVCHERLAEPFLGAGASFLHGLTFAGHPVSCAVALANLDLFDREDILAAVRAREGGLRARLEALGDLPLVGDVRGAGWFWAIELVRDQATAARFGDEERAGLIAAVTAGLTERGVLARVDDRSGVPVVQLSPPLVADDAVLDEITDALRGAIGAAGERFAA